MTAVCAPHPPRQTTVTGHRGAPGRAPTFERAATEQDPEKWRGIGTRRLRAVGAGRTGFKRAADWRAGPRAGERARVGKGRGPRKSPGLSPPRPHQPLAGAFLAPQPQGVALLTPRVSKPAPRPHRERSRPASRCYGPVCHVVRRLGRAATLLVPPHVVRNTRWCCRGLKLTCRAPPRLCRGNFAKPRVRDACRMGEHKA